MRASAYAAVMAAGLAVSSVAVAGGYKPAVKVKVYCTSDNSASGLVKPQVADSLRDLKASIAKKQDWLTVVETAADANLMLEVLDRDYAANGVVESKYDTSSKSVKTEEKHDYVVSVRLLSGDFKSEMTGRCTGDALWGGWRCATGDVAGQVEKFVQGNYDRLVAASAVSRPPAAAPAHARAAAAPAGVAAAHAEAKAPATTSGEVLTNKSVIDMVAAGLGDAVIVQKIKKSTSHFDTSTDKLIALRKAGVSEKVLAAI